MKLKPSNTARMQGFITSLMPNVSTVNTTYITPYTLMKAIAKFLG